MANQDLWVTKSSDVVYQNPWIIVREDIFQYPSGKEGIYGVIQAKGDGVQIIPFNSRGEVYLQYQFRYPLRRYFWEIPGGKLDSPDIFKEAKRELWEETGLTPGSLEHIGTIPAWNGFCTELVEIVIAHNCTGIPQSSDEEEDIAQIQAYSPADIMTMINTGTIDDSQTISALMRAFIHLKLVQVGKE